MLKCVLYLQVTEPWEHEKTEADMEKFFFENSRIEKKACKTLAKVKSSVSSEKVSFFSIS